MCIRDSAYAARHLSELLVLGGQRQALLQGRIQIAGIVGAKSPIGSALRPVAVSYTHLRAHETVLDLVCRLLLETKKQYCRHLS